MARLMTSLAAAQPSGGDETIGHWAATHGVGGVATILIAGAILWAIFAAIGKRRN